MGDNVIGGGSPPGMPIGGAKRPYRFYITPEVLHEIKSRAGQIGGRLSHGGGKPNFAPGEERTVFKMLKSTRDALMRCARFEGCFANDFLHALVESLKHTERYAHLFPEENGDETNPSMTQEQEKALTMATEGINQQKRYKAVVRLLDGSDVRVYSTARHPTSHYGLQVWCDKGGHAYGQIDLQHPFYIAHAIEEISEDEAAKFEEYYR